MADIKLTDGQVIAQSTDLCLDSMERRTNNTPNRRALVHDYGDRLTLNWGGDYPAGVKIEGKVEIGQIANPTHQLKIQGWDLLLDAPERRQPGSDPTKPRRALVHDYGDRLTLNWGGDYPAGVKIEGNLELTGSLLVPPPPGGSPPGGPTPPPVDLVQQVRHLTALVVQLQKQVAALQAKVGP